MTLAPALRTLQDGLFVTARIPTDWTDRHTVMLVAGCGIAAFALAVAVSIGMGNLALSAGLAALALAPLLLVTAFRWPYLFPYGMYAALVPFDDVLSLPGGGTITRLLGLASIFFIALFAARKRRLSSPPLALYFWLGLLLWVIVEMLRAYDAGEAQKVVQTFLSLVLLFAALAVAPIEERQLRSVCAAIVIGGVIASLYGIYLFHSHPEFVAKVEGRLTINMFGRTLDPNGYADSLLGPFALALVSLLNSRRPGKVLTTLTALAIIFGAIVASLSREALLSCVVVIGVTIWFSRRRLLGFAIAIPACAMLPIFVPAIVQRMTSAVSTGGAGRTSIWHVDWIAFLQQPLIGWGTSNSIEAYNHNYLAVFQAYNAGWSRPPHNTALFLGVEFGIVGILLFYGGWLSAFRGMRSIQRGDSLYDLKVGLTGGLAAMLLAGVFVDVTPHKHLWLLLAAAAQLRTIALARRANAPAVVYESAAEVTGAGRAALRPMFRNGSSM